MGHILKLVIFLKIKFDGLACNLSGNVNLKTEGKKVMKYTMVLKQNHRKFLSVVLNGSGCNVYYYQIHFNGQRSPMTKANVSNSEKYYYFKSRETSQEA